MYVLGARGVICQIEVRRQ
uniref:Uncharacterized protein n=1 Tax=Rhizophora mucronata TaxID=61149 RepID=A0A2P2P4E1_RHIMU